MLDQSPNAVARPQRTTALIRADLRDATRRAQRVMVTDSRHALIHAEINRLLDELNQCASS